MWSPSKAKNLNAKFFSQLRQLERAGLRPTERDDNDGLLDPEEFDAEAGRDIAHELRYVRTGREKRNYGA